MVSSPPSDSRPQRLDPRAVDRAWDRLLAGAELPWLHAEAARRLAERLPLVRQRPARVLDWWSGPGGPAAALRAAYPKAELVPVRRPRALAPSRPAEIEAPPATGWRRWLGRAPAQPAGVDEDAVPAGQAQLVWSNLALHAALEVPALMQRWQRALQVDGFLMFTTFGPGTLATLGALYRAEGWGPPAPPWIDMHDLGDMLVEAGFADPVMDQELLQLTWSSPQAALDELRSLGANTDRLRMAGLRTPRWRARLHEALRARADRDGRVRLEIELVYGHAFKVAPRVRVESHTTVDLAQMKTILSQGRTHR